jgi:hypothetical protein
MDNRILTIYMITVNGFEQMNEENVTEAHISACHLTGYGVELGKKGAGRMTSITPRVAKDQRSPISPP